MHEVDRLEWPDHDAKLDDLAGVVAPDDVDAVHVLAFDGGLELGDGGFWRPSLATVSHYSRICIVWQK